ncbi:hypothetical protein AGLY_009543, partial [Aphis glycines]
MYTIYACLRPAAVVPVQQQSGRRLVHAHAHARALRTHTPSPSPHHCRRRRVVSSRSQSRTRSRFNRRRSRRRRRRGRVVFARAVFVIVFFFFFFFCFPKSRRCTRPHTQEENYYSPEERTKYRALCRRFVLAATTTFRGSQSDRNTRFSAVRSGGSRVAFGVSRQRAAEYTRFRSEVANTIICLRVHDNSK